MLSDFAKKEKPCLALKNRIFQSPKNPLFQTCHFFSLFRFDQNNTRNNAFWLCKEKRIFLTLKNSIFQSPKNRIFSGDNSCFWWKNANYLVYLDLVKIRLEIMLSDFSKGLTHAFGQKCYFFFYLNLIKIRLEIMHSDFPQKKETFFDLEKQNFWKSKKSHFFRG